MCECDMNVKYNENTSTFATAAAENVKPHYNIVHARAFLLTCSPLFYT